MLRGKIDAVARGRVLGWLWDDSRPLEAVEFTLLVNGEAVGRFPANEYRSDLARHHVGSGAHAFDIRLDPQWTRPGSNDLQVTIEGEAPDRVPRLQFQSALEKILEVDGPAARAPAQPRTIRGRIEKLHQGMVLGWVWDTRTDDPVEFTLFVNEKPVGDYQASETRADLVREGIGSGAHAFRIPLEKSWITAGETTFTLRTLADQQRLPDALVVRRVERSATANAEIKESGPRPTKEPGSEKALVAELSGWPTRKLIAFHTQFEVEVVLQRARQLLKDKKWDELSALLPVTRVNRRGRAELHILIGRGLLQHRDNENAAAVLSAAAEQHADNVNAQFYASVACARSGRFEQAVSYGRSALRLAPENKQYLVDHGTSCRRYATRIEGDVNLRRSVLLESIDSFKRALAIDDSRADYCLVQMARSYLELDLHQDALDCLDRMLAIEPAHVDSLLLKSQALVALNRVGEALQIAEHVIELDPMRQGPRFLLRSLRALAGDEQARPPTFGVARWDVRKNTVDVSEITFGPEGFHLGEAVVIEHEANPAMALATLQIDWLLITDADPGTALGDQQVIAQLRSNTVSWAGHLRAGETGTSLWRRELLIGFAEANLITDLATLPEALLDLLPLVQSFDVFGAKGERQDLLQHDSRITPGPVIVMSRHGIVKFGGGEQFLDSMAEHYERMGLDPIIVGTRPERVGDEGVENGRRFAFVDMAPAALRAYFIKVKPRFVHVLSGLGYQTAEALEYLNIPFVYGVHFWRDALGKTEDDTNFFTDLDKGPIPKPAFRYIIQKASTVYSNSQYSRAVLEEAFQFRTPVIYSVPRDPTPTIGKGEAEIEGLGALRDFVLLVNAHSDKGLDLLIDTAKRVPLINFVAIASQTDRRDAEAAVASAGLTNFRIIGHTNRMDALYERAKVAAVPSYRFVETFSRVCIEAQRYGRPVLGSTIGNVPYLLETSGVVLPEDAQEWANELTRIYRNKGYYESLVVKARVNSERFSYAEQAKNVSGMISTVHSPLLIGVGSGIGNMLHVTPMIRNIVMRTGRKVDLVMTEDHENSLFLLHNDDLVNSVYSVRQTTLRRHYENVFITHCFGDARVPFQARNVIYARNWKNFEPGGPLHEAEYNLEAAKQLLGIPYDADDVHGYYLGNYSYTPPPLDTVRIGFHGGSKDGFWRSKRWPGHPELAQRLQGRGFEVSSFGIAEEYVPGTIDLTGGTISEMVAKMLNLHYLVSNDSGLMNIANALGIPVMAMFAPTNPQTRAPVRPIGRWIAVEKSCSPCEVTREGAATFKSGQCQCIAEIMIDPVERAVLAHLAELYPQLGNLDQVA